METILRVLLGAVGVGILSGVGMVVFSEMDDNIVVWIPPLVSLMCLIGVNGFGTFLYILVVGLISVSIGVLIYAVATITLTLVIKAINWLEKRG